MQLHTLFYDIFYIWHTATTYFDDISVEYFAELIGRWKMSLSIEDKAYFPNCETTFLQK